MFKNKSLGVMKIGVLACFALLAACGGGSGGGSPPATSPPASVTSVPSVPIVPIAPAPVAPAPVAPAPVAPAPVAQATVANVVTVTVDNGPAEYTTGNNLDNGPAEYTIGNNFNRLYTDVTICQAGSTTACQTIDHVLVDTGSTGLRLLAGVVSPALNLPKAAAISGFPLLACEKFVDNSFAWGSVVNADILMAGKIAAGAPVQLMADPAFTALQDTCSTGTPLNTIALLGAKGIIGIGVFKEDCGPLCEHVAANGVYFTCTTAACTSAVPTMVSADKQIKNPIALFASDNNGFVIELPAVSAAGEVSIKGSLIFGIGTQANNQTASSQVLKLSTAGYFSTTLDSLLYSRSFIDTGSNGIYFDTPNIPTCSNKFYCPAAIVNLSATQLGTNSVPNVVNFSVDNAPLIFSKINAGASNSLLKRVLPNISARFGNSKSFYWGLPFYYGKRVFTGIEGQPSPVGTGPLYAF